MKEIDFDLKNNPFINFKSLVYDLALRIKNEQ